MRILIADESGKLPERLSALLHDTFGGDDAAGEAGSTVTRLVVSMLSRSRERDAYRDLDLHDQPELSSTILDALGLALLHRGCLDDARPLLERALEIRRQFYGDDHPATASSLNSTARLRRKAGDLKGALADARRALAINSRIYGGESLPVALTLNELAVTLLEAGQYTEAEQSAQGGLHIMTALHLECSDPYVTRLLDTLGRVQQVRGRYEQATEIYLKTLDLDRRQVGERHLKYATHLANFATVKVGQGKLEEAQRDFEAALKVLRDDTHRPRHPNVIDVLANLGSLLRIKGDLDGALDVLQEALKLDEEIRKPDHLLVGNDHARLGRVNHEAGRFAAAEEHFGRALEIYQSNVAAGKLAQSHPFFAEARTWLARSYVERENPRPADASDQARAALKIWAEEFGELSVEHAITSAVLGRALFLIDNRSSEARERLTKAYPIVVAARGEESAIAKLIEAWRDEANGSQAAREAQ